MSPPGLRKRRPIFASNSIIILATLLQQSTAHAVPQIPQPTKTVPYHEINVLEWPLAATDAPTVPGLLGPRQLNTVCGYIGGDPDMPATCTAGSYCALDVEHKAIGCCPDGGPCTTGVFTGCVDSDSDPQTELNPYVFTCRGGKACYRNDFEGGFSQYGCGSADMAATVAITASGKSKIPFSTFSAALTEKPKSLSKPTTIGTKHHRTSTNESTKSHSHTKTDTKTTTKLATTTDSTTTSNTASSTATQTSDATAPNNAPVKNNGAIIGGTISGVAFVAALAVLGVMLWRRRRNRNLRQGPGVQADPRYIK